MLRGHAARLLFLVGILGGLVLSRVVTPAEASRNGSGTYSLPAGNPVVSGTAISSTVHNATMSDIASEITGSLAINGSSAMTAALRLASGTVGTPGLNFSADTDTGLYRIGSNNVGLSLGGTKYIDFSTTTPLAVTGAATISAGLTVTQSTSATAGITSTGGATSGNGGTFTGTGSGKGGAFTGGLTGIGVTGTGGATSGRGGEFTGGATGAEGLACTATGDNHGETCTGSTTGSGGNFVGGATGSGVTATAGGTPTADTNTRYAYRAIGGHYQAGGGNPTSTVAFSNALTPSNIIKAWGKVASDGVGGATVTAGFNITSVACGGTGNDSFVVTMASAMTGTNNYVVLSGFATSTSMSASNQSATVFNVTNGASACDTVATGADFIVVGLQ